ncbi:MAG: M20/M25/M40 family metallo-hydrolase [candidate division KSB1 bacterium]|nr:M20/M25/M40 family metallo-hydrolase [candidate division KSB1 bacterium]
MMHRRFWLVRLFTTAVLIGATGTASAQFRIDAIRQFRMQHEKAILSQLVEWLHIPNVASDSANIRRNADFIMELMRKRSIQTRLLTVPGSPPAVYGELRVPGATKTVMLYVHYDGQPVNPAQWDSDPWQPVFRDRLPQQGGRTMSLDELPDPVPGELRVYARSASDDKSPLIALLAAIDALKTNRIPITVNLKFFLEGEEEAGSPHMRAFLEKYSDLLHADVWLLCDGPVHQTGKKLVYFGARGITGVDITTYGAARPLHSGHYGNWAPNPISQLVHLLASLRDIDGRVLIDGYMDDVRPLTETEKQAIAAAPNLEQHLKDELALAWTEGRGRRLEELILRPAVNFKGFVSGQVGEKARNAIQTEARASVGFRLVPRIKLPKKCASEWRRISANWVFISSMSHRTSRRAGSIRSWFTCTGKKAIRRQEPPSICRYRRPSSAFWKRRAASQSWCCRPPEAVSPCTCFRKSCILKSFWSQWSITTTINMPKMRICAFKICGTASKCTRR